MEMRRYDSMVVMGKREKNSYPASPLPGMKADTSSWCYSNAVSVSNGELWSSALVISGD